MANDCFPAYDVPELSVIIKVIVTVLIWHAFEIPEKSHLSRLLSFGL